MAYFQGLLLLVSGRVIQSTKIGEVKRYKMMNKDKVIKMSWFLALNNCLILLEVMNVARKLLSC